MSIARDSNILETLIVSKLQAVGQIIPVLQNLLINHHVTLSDIACIGVNTGPGPFNTLRAIVATANGLSFARNIPLIACNGLELLLQENTDQNQIAILDAFGTDVYYAIKSSTQQGYTSITDLIHSLNTSHPHQTLNFIGNGSIKHADYIKETFTGTVKIDTDLLFASSQSLINETFKKFSQGLTEKEIYPLYFQSPVTKP